ncbi:unnamed protein product [Microthlaspi erraticum]|uniref:DUF4283 domain-containing protein n=1 Tax=Microthlaspi erraticum TaxID=1685480 RepID=A0A6D2JR41_9BRAS|nr:unnamed protein product [Microthlaspi erraticum]
MAEGASLPPSPIPQDLLFISASPPLGSDLVSSPTVSQSMSVVAQLPAPLCEQSPIAKSCAPSQPEKPASWTSNFKPHFKNLTKIGSPTVSSDGIPQIQAPDSIILTSTQMWKNHIIAYFHGNPPSPAKIFSDLNPIWGLKGRISIKHHSSSVFLILIPDVETRNWVLNVGFSHSGNCSITVTPWEASTAIRKMKLVHAPVWVLFRHVPPELLSEVGFSTIASAVGIPVHTEYPNIKPYSNGVVKLRVVIELAKKRANSIRVKDKLGNSALVLIEVLKLPPRCRNCREFGHLNLRCPVPLTKPVLKPPNPLAPSPKVCQKDSSSVSVSGSSQVASSTNPTLEKVQEVVNVSSEISSQDCSSPLAGSLEADPPEPLPEPSPPDDFITVSGKSLPITVPQIVSEKRQMTSPVSSTQTGEKEGKNKGAHLVSMNRFKVLQGLGSSTLLVLLPKVQRKVQRQKASLASEAMIIDFTPGLDPEEEAVSGSGIGLIDRSEHPPIADVPVLDS